MAMRTEERIRIARIIDKIEKNRAFSKRIGIRITSEYGKERGQKSEVHRCRF